MLFDEDVKLFWVSLGNQALTFSVEEGYACVQNGDTIWCLLSEVVWLRQTDVSKDRFLLAELKIFVTFLFAYPTWRR